MLTTESSLLRGKRQPKMTQTVWLHSSRSLRERGTQRTLLTSNTDLFCPVANNSHASFCILSEFSFFNGIYYLLSGEGVITHIHHVAVRGQDAGAGSLLLPHSSQGPDLTLSGSAASVFSSSLSHLAESCFLFRISYLDVLTLF